MNIRRILSVLAMKYAQFMQGRYGNDTLGTALLIFGFLFSGILSLVRVSSLPALIFLRVLSNLPYIIMLCRFLSKNVPARQRENARFMKFFIPIKNSFTQKARQAQDTAHKYYPCPGCGANLRVPRGRGKIKIQCPHCSREFTRNTGKRS